MSKNESGLNIRNFNSVNAVNARRRSLIADKVARNHDETMMELQGLKITKSKRIMIKKRSETKPIYSPSSLKQTLALSNKKIDRRNISLTENRILEMSLS